MLFLSRELNDFLGGYCYANKLKFFALIQKIVYDWAVTKGFTHECRRSETKTANQTVCMICGKELSKKPMIKVVEDGKVWK